MTDLDVNVLLTKGLHVLATFFSSHVMEPNIYIMPSLLFVLLSCPLFSINFVTACSGERGGSVVECLTPEREVGSSKPTAAVLCP